MSILSAIGNTPLVELNRLNSKKPKVRIFGKFEGANPGGSVKDRPAYWMIKKAEESGELTKGKIILEPTSRRFSIFDFQLSIGNRQSQIGTPTAATVI